MQCEEFLQRFSDYLDDLLSPEERTAFSAHSRGCEACRRYQRVVKQGLELCKHLPHVHSSPDFLPRLQHRLYHVDDGPQLAEHRHVGSAALVAVASVGILALAWLPFATRVSVEVELPPVAVSVPAPGAEAAAARQPSLFGSGPFLQGTGDQAWPWQVGMTLDAPVRFFPLYRPGPSSEADKPTAATDPSR